MRGNMTGFVKPLLMIMGAIVGVIAVAFLVAGLMGGNKELGAAVDFTAKDAVGESFTLSKNYEGGVALIFLNRSQGDGIAHLTNMAAAKEGKDIKTVLVAIGEKSGKEITDYLKDNHLTADVVIPDEKGEIAALYNVTTCPITYFIDGEGVVRGVSLSNLTPTAAAKYYGYIEN
ncbi:MAG: TlpA family protein disulfide reductase [Clostridia bacterium]|nr:TlpA family protein disulfide reductase [Clostridia bacterium]